jgi:hypothetical protein
MTATYLAFLKGPKPRRTFSHPHNTVLSGHVDEYKTKMETDNSTILLSVSDLDLGKWVFD